MDSMIIAISGTPGTGKSTLARKISEKLGYDVLDVNKLLEEDEGLVLEFDRRRDTKVIDTERLNDVLIQKIDETKKAGKGLVIDSHLSHMLPKEEVGLCIVLSCDLSVLKERLVERGYNNLKIKENLEAEAFDEILEEARETGHEVLNIKTESGYDLDWVLDEIRKREIKDII